MMSNAGIYWKKPSYGPSFEEFVNDELLKSVQKIIRDINSQKRDKRLDAAKKAGDHLEYGYPSPEFINMLVEALYKRLLHEKEPDIIEAVLYSMACVEMNPYPRINFSILAKRLKNYEPLCIVYALTILGMSKDKQFEPIIRSHLDSPAPTVRDAAKKALVELKREL